MIAETLATDDPNVRLVEPDIERDASLSVQWLKGANGYNTMKLMGVPDEQNKPTTLEQEKKRVSEFISKESQLNWMIEYRGQIVGSIWVDLESSTRIPSPAVSIMIGSSNIRGKGIGQTSLDAVINYLRKKGMTEVYYRHLIDNKASKHLLLKHGFSNLAGPYIDEDGLEWQNVRRPLSQ